MKRYLALPLLALLVACAQLGLEAPVTPEEKIAAGFSTATAVNQSVSALLRERKISSADAEQIVASNKALVQGLRVARGMLGTDPAGAAAKAAAVRAGLDALREYLRAKGGKL